MAWGFSGAKCQSALEAICLRVKWIIEADSSELNTKDIKDVTSEKKAGAEGLGRAK